MFKGLFVNNNNKSRFISIDDSSFYAHAFALTVQSNRLRNSDDDLNSLFYEPSDEASQDLHLIRLQEGCLVRNLRLARQVAHLLISDAGELNLTELPLLIDQLKARLYSLGPNRQNDSKYQVCLFNALIALNKSKELVRLIRSVDKPVSNKNAEDIIRETLQLPMITSITDAHARRGVLSAWMCLLRQNVGSCFATAPGIIIHDEQYETFLNDIIALLNTGRLKRVSSGIEYSVPLSGSSGAGDLKKLFQLKKDDLDPKGISREPGLVLAFQSAGVIDPKNSSRKNDVILSDLIKKSVKSIFQQQSVIIISCEEIIRRVLLVTFNITDRDVHEYQNRPQGIILSGLVIEASKSKVVGKGDLCRIFLEKFKMACSAFKGHSDNALLKVWEFTLASFAETKAQFTRWNLYSSLGFGSNEKGGIGLLVYEISKQKLDDTNQKVTDSQYEYEQVFTQLKGLEARMQHVESERDAQWLRVEYQSRRNEFYSLEEMRNTLNHKAHQLANLYSHLLEQYDALFPSYFQEVYDADMRDITASYYDDSPAGFRLLYKYGRSNTSQWSYIYSPTDFIEALSSFFIATEHEIASSDHFSAVQAELSEVITAVVTHIRTKEFLESAFYRMAAAHQTSLVADPLNHLDQIDKKPWAYTSGGTMNTLISCYFRLEDKPTEVSRWVENPFELSVFLVDTIKQMPTKITDVFNHSSSKSLLMHSPTHAFLLKPGKKLFKEAWQSDVYTYTWIRDQIILPRKEFLNRLWLEQEMVQYLVDHLAQSVPKEYRQNFIESCSSINGNIHPNEFRDRLLENIQQTNGFRNVYVQALSGDKIDSMLYSLLPLFDRSSLEERVLNIFKAIPGLQTAHQERLMKAFQTFSPSVVPVGVTDAAQLQNICKGLICLAFDESSFPVDYHAAVSFAAQQLGYAMLEPFTFADTNWATEEFAFVVNPGTNEFELWRVDATGRSGMPMSSWAEWLNGSRKDQAWGVYTKPYEYSP